MKYLISQTQDQTVIFVTSEYLTQIVKSPNGFDSKPESTENGVDDMSEDPKITITGN
jgi:hypothetical protein